jgi:hypothetical protein
LVSSASPLSSLSSVELAAELAAEDADELEAASATRGTAVKVVNVGARVEVGKMLSREFTISFE